MSDKRRLPESDLQASKSTAKQIQSDDTDSEKFRGPHVGSSDAFSQTENTASSDADNMTDEKLDDLLDED